MKKAFCRQCGVLLAISEIEKGFCNSCLSEIPVADKAEQQQSASEKQQPPVAQPYQPAQPIITAEIDSGQPPNTSWCKPVKSGLEVIFFSWIAYLGFAALFIALVLILRQNAALLTINIFTAITLLINDSLLPPMRLGLVFSFFFMGCFLFIFIASFMCLKAPKSARLPIYLTVAGLVLLLVLTPIQGLLQGTFIHEVIQLVQMNRGPQLEQKGFEEAQQHLIRTPKFRNVYLSYMICNILSLVLSIAVAIFFLVFLWSLSKYLQKKRLARNANMMLWISIALYIIIIPGYILGVYLADKARVGANGMMLLLMLGIGLSIFILVLWIYQLVLIWNVRSAIVEHAAPKTVRYDDDY